MGKITRKPSYILCLIKALVVSWLVTGVLLGGLYVYFDNKCKNVYRTMWQEMEDDICEKTGALYNAANDKEYNEALVRLDHSISKAAAEGIYTEVQFASDTVTWSEDMAYLIYTDKDSGQEKIFKASLLNDGVLIDGLKAVVGQQKTVKTFKHEAEIRYVDCAPFIGALYTMIYKDQGLLQEDIEVTNGSDRLGFIGGCINEEDMTFWLNEADNLIDGRKTDTLYYITTQSVEGYAPLATHDVDSPRIETYVLPQGLTYADPSEKNITCEGGNSEDWKVTFRVPGLMSLADVFPVMISETLIIAFVFCTFIAVIVSVVRYANAKNVYDLFEYRRKTTDAMAHDLKTPLAAISGYAENLQENTNPDKAAYYISKIREHADSMNNMIVEILNLSRSEDGRLNIDKEKVDVLKLVEETCAQNNIRADIKGKATVIITDRRLFKQSVDNLLSNAVKFAREGSTVQIDVDDRGLAIRNEFEGEIEDADKLKEAFVKGSDARNAGGNGLGLAIVNNNLRALGHKLILTAKEGRFEALIKF